ncbi:MAG: ABC transporter permease [Candidatus Eisenbacteria bacterium]
MVSTRVEHVFRELGCGFRRSLRSHLAPVVLMGVALFVFGLFLLGTKNLQKVIRLAQQKVGITVYLRDDATEADQTRLTDLFSRLGGVSGARYLSPEDALEGFRQTLGPRAYLLEGVEGNPLPASFELELYDDWKTLERIRSLASEVELQGGVESVVFGENWVGKLERWIYFFVAVDLFLGIVLGLATILVVENTMKLAIADRRDTIEILRLVGATPTQIRLPYLLEGAILGFTAALLALLILRESHSFASARLPGVLFLDPFGVFSFLLIGGALGAGGTLLSLNRYLRYKKS